MLPYLGERFGNPSSAHVYGYSAQAAAEDARQQVAALLHVPGAEVVFTSGGSEGDNLAIKGSVFAHWGLRPHVITTTIEHSAVLNTLHYLRDRFGASFTMVSVDSHGLVDPDAVRQAIRPETVLITVMHANNEVGTVQPVPEIAGIAAEHGVTLHVDAAQSAGKVPLGDVTSCADLVTVAGHKIYAPKGIGAAYIRKGTSVDPLIHGSSQEHGMRAGTEPVASIVALGTACAIAAEHLEAEVLRLTALRDRLFVRLRDALPGVTLNGHPTQRLPNTLNVSFPGTTGAQLLAACPEVAASTGSACHAASPEPSPVLLAMGLGLERALGAVRFSLGRWTTEEDIDRAGEALTAAYRSLAGAGAVQA
jgi:cysteine desulfurase